VHSALKDEPTIFMDVKPGYLNGVADVVVTMVLRKQGLKMKGRDVSHDAAINVSPIMA